MAPPRDIDIKDYVERILNERNVAGVESIRRLDDRITHLEERLLERWQAQQSELDTAVAHFEKRLEAALVAQGVVNLKQNEFRGALSDQAERVVRDMMPRREFETRHLAIEAEYETRQHALEVEIDTLRGESREEDKEITLEFAALRLKLDNDVNGLRASHDRDVSTLRTEMIEGPRREAQKRVTTMIAAVAAFASLAYILVAVITHGLLP